MKIGIINQTSSVGGFRYLYNLVKGLKEVNKELDITILITDSKKNSTLAFEIEELIKYRY